MRPEPAKEQELLAGAKQRDADAVNQLLDRHRRAVQRLARMELGRQCQTVTSSTPTDREE